MATKKTELYFSNKDVEAKQKSQRLAELTTAMKDGLNKAIGNSLNVTYEKTFRILKRIAPEVNQDIGRFFMTEKSEPIIIAELRELLETDGKAKSIEELIERELSDKNDRISRGKHNPQGIPRTFKHLEKRIRQLWEAKEYLRKSEEKVLVEETALRRDYYQAQREETVAVQQVLTDDYRAFVLPGNRLMQMRLWHNLPPEKITGVDLVYEQIDLNSKKIRFVHLQYKMWDGRSFSVNTNREQNQLKKIQKTFCDNKLCKPSSEELPYRLPYCCAFYKPTHKRQSKDDKMITTGVHLPACLVDQLLENKTSIPKEIIYGQGLASNVFDDLFRSGLVGSGWQSLAKMQKFYKKHQIIESDNSFVLNIRDEIGHSEENLEQFTRLRDVIGD